MRRSFVIVIFSLSLAVVGSISLGHRARIQAQQSPVAVSSNAVAGAFFGPNQEEPIKKVIYLPPQRMSVAELKTRLKLQEKITLKFDQETSLDVVKKFIEESTVDKTDFPDGLSLYFDPQGLQEADKTMASTIQLSVKNLPLETSLSLLLNQVGMGYWINKDGLIIITSNEKDNPILSQRDIDNTILSSLSELRDEIKQLRDEVWQSRPNPKNFEERPSSQPSLKGMGVNGGFP